MAKRTRSPRETRPVLRCPQCRLNQFLTRSGGCRRCGKRLAASGLADVVPASQPPVQRQPIAMMVTPALPTMIVYPTVGETIRQRRMEMGFTQGSLARFLGWRHTALCDMECNRRRPGLPLRRMLAEALQCSVADFSPASPGESEAA